MVLLMSTHLPPLEHLKYLLFKMLCVHQSYTITFQANSRAVLAQRAFQDVPRSLRRRSASHNVKRVPRRIREKATREMIADGTKPPVKTRGRRRLQMEKRRLAGKSQPTEQPEDMAVDGEADEMGIPKLKPRKVTKGKFARRQG